MLKVLITIGLGILLVGCCAERDAAVKSQMFQSVDKESATLVQNSKDKHSCYRCGMNLVKFYKTSHSASIEGVNYQYCSIHCLEDHLGDGVTIKNPQVVDVTSLKFIDVNKAFYVVGSKVRGTMSMVSKYAFLNEDDAKKFQAQNGGEIMDFNGALKKAKEDFAY